MIRRIYAHNFRCFQNTEVDLADRRHALLVGRNGSGKSSLLDILQSFRLLAYGRNRADEFIPRRSVTALLPVESDPSHPFVRFELELDLPEGMAAAYSLALELPPGFREMRVAAEHLAVGGVVLLDRRLGDVTFGGTPTKRTQFTVDWHQIALTVIGVGADDHPVERFRRELRRLVLLRPIPSAMMGEGGAQVTLPDPSCREYGNWFRELVNAHPGVYQPFKAYMQEVLPGFEDARNRPTGQGVWNLVYEFRGDRVGSYTVPFDSLSDGEKCLSVAALVCAIADADPPVTIWWDEPDGFVALPEVQHLILALRRAVGQGSQFIATSHDAEAIRAFSRENALIMYRASHSEPSRVRPASDLIKPSDDLADVLARGDDVV